jgi:hypothetical protein
MQFEKETIYYCENLIIILKRLLKITERERAAKNNKGKETKLMMKMVREIKE